MEPAVVGGYWGLRPGAGRLGGIEEWEWRDGWGKERGGGWGMEERRDGEGQDRGIEARREGG